MSIPRRWLHFTSRTKDTLIDVARLKIDTSSSLLSLKQLGRFILQLGTYLTNDDLSLFFIQKQIPNEKEEESFKSLFVLYPGQSSRVRVWSAPRHTTHTATAY